MVNQYRTLARVSEWLGEIARALPLNPPIDDLQWADQASIARLLHLTRRLGTAPLLVIGLFFQPK